MGSFRKFFSYIILVFSFCFVVFLLLFEATYLPDFIQKELGKPNFRAILNLLAVIVGGLNLAYQRRLDFGLTIGWVFWHDFLKVLFFILAIISFVTGLTNIVLAVVGVWGKSSTGAGDLLSAGGLILAVVSAYYLWALARAEEEAKKLIVEMREKNARIKEVENRLSEFEKIVSEKSLYSNINALNYVTLLLVRTTHNVSSTLKTSSLSEKYKKSLDYQIKIIRHLQVLTGFIKEIGGITKLEVKNNIKDIAENYKYNISTLRENPDLIEWEAIAPLLESFMRQLRMMFPRKNEYSKDVWALIEAICNDLDLDPDSL